MYDDFGREMSTPLDIISESLPETDIDSESDFECHTDPINQLQGDLKVVHALARENIKRAAERQKNQYDLGVHNPPVMSGNMCRETNDRIPLA